MIPVQLDLIQSADLERLIEGQVREGRDIEYKREFPTGKDKDKVHFLKAITSLANSGGGDVIYGMDAKDGIPTAVCGFALEGSQDEHQLRFENFLRDGVQPRLPGIGFHWIEVDAGKSALVVRVNSSWNAPHRVVVDNHNHFYGRNSVGAYPLDVTELRAAFALSETTGQRIADFRAARLMRIEARRTPIELEDHGLAVIHVVPISAFSGVSAVALQATKDLARKFSLVAGHGCCPDVNLDGAVHFERRDTANRMYTQVFRNGSLEMVTTLPPYSGDQLRISGDWLVRCIVEALGVNLRSLVTLGLSGPFAVSLAFIGVKQYAFEAGDDVRRWSGSFQDATLVLPDILVDDADGDVAQQLRSMFDVLWNGFGWEKCTTYNDDGTLRSVRA